MGLTRCREDYRVCNAYFAPHTVPCSYISFDWNIHMHSNVGLSSLVTLRRLRNSLACQIKCIPRVRMKAFIHNSLPFSWLSFWPFFTYLKFDLLSIHALFNSTLYCLKTFTVGSQPEQPHSSSVGHRTATPEKLE